ncbi:MAG: hypothetical protein R6U28_00310 [Cyclonatronaceae bacterium]
MVDPLLRQGKDNTWKLDFRAVYFSEKALFSVAIKGISAFFCA